MNADFEVLVVSALCAWNNVPAGFSWPKDFPEGSREAWRRVVTAVLERNAAAQSGAKLGDVPLSTGTGQGKAPEINDGLGTIPQQTNEDIMRDTLEGMILHKHRTDYEEDCYACMADQALSACHFETV